jgi:pyruvate formate lyase activating enzyme
MQVAEIQKFCSHDGPGLRTTVFFKGCPLRCVWCHNPETQQFAPQVMFYDALCIGCGACVSACPTGAQVLTQNDRRRVVSLCEGCGVCARVCLTEACKIVGTDMRAEQILAEVLADAAFYGNTGGVTLSGGEPFMQSEGALELLRECKKRGLSTVVETCGYADEKTLISASEFVDLFLWDLKDSDGERHKKYTGVSNSKILDNLFALNRKGAKIRLRCILVKGVNTDEKHYESIAETAEKIKNLDGVEFIPYHAYAGTKATFIGKEDNGKLSWIPQDSDLEKAKAILKARGVMVL